MTHVEKFFITLFMLSFLLIQAFPSTNGEWLLWFRLITISLFILAGEDKKHD